MAYLLEKNSLFYIYDKDPITKKYRCVQALGNLSPKAADDELIKWKADNMRGKGPISAKDRSMSSVWHEFLQFMVANEYEASTIRDYTQCITPFVESMKHLRELTVEKIRAWDVFLQNSYCKDSETPRLLAKETRSHRLRAISAFCGWIADESRQYLAENPFKTKIPRQRKDAGRALTGDEVKRLLANWPAPRRGRWDKYAELSKLFYMIKFYAGTRSKELLGFYDPHTGKEHLGITYECLNRRGEFFTLGKTKDGTAREVALAPEIMALIPHGSGPIFYGKIGETALANHLKRACKAAGITGRFRPHDSRVTAATDWGRRKEDDRDMMDQFGWKTAAMAAHYKKGATANRVRAAKEMYR